MDVERAVLERYSAASREVEPCLCCAVGYDPRYLEVLPPEILERDYGCGDPTRWVREGETVLDLGAGGGKVCYIAAQVVGPTGTVIGVDMNDEMLALARAHCESIGRRLGYHNVSFRKGRIQDLALDLDAWDAWLRSRPVATAGDWLEALRQAERRRSEQPLIADQSIDVVLSNCVLNLVDPADRSQLFRELYRVLKPTGRAVISDIVSSAPVPVELQRNPTLWSGCISGAYEEQAFLEAFRAAGFRDVQLVERQDQPWTTVANIEFRSVTVRATKVAAEFLPVTVLGSPCPPGGCCDRP